MPKTLSKAVPYSCFLPSGMDPLPLTGRRVCKTGQGAGVWLNAMNYFEIIYVWWFLVGGSIVVAHSTSVCASYAFLGTEKGKNIHGMHKGGGVAYLGAVTQWGIYAAICSLYWMPQFKFLSLAPANWGRGFSEEKNVPRRKKKCMFLPLFPLSFRLQGFFL